MALIVKCIPLLMGIGLSGIVVLGRKNTNSNEEIEMNLMSQDYKDVEKNWGEEENKDKKISWWKRESNGFKRNEERRIETHKNIFIFDLCNEWIKFVEVTNSDKQDDLSEGYGYLWKDICNLVKTEKEINWLDFVTKLMKTDNAVTIKECCLKEDAKICQALNSWEKGQWLKKCFEKELERAANNSPSEAKNICKGIWEIIDEKDQLIKSSEEERNKCLNENIGKKISERIKIKRSSLGDNQDQKYWCQNEKNGYKKNNGNSSIGITKECKEILKAKIKEFLQKDKNAKRNNNNCWSLYSWGKLEVKCEDDWIIRNEISSIY